MKTIFTASFCVGKNVEMFVFLHSYPQTSAFIFFIKKEIAPTH